MANQSANGPNHPDSVRNHRKGESPKTQSKDLKGNAKYKQSMSQSLGGLQYNFQPNHFAQGNMSGKSQQLGGISAKMQN